MQYCRIYSKIHRHMCRAYIVTQMSSSCPKRQVSDRIIPTLNVCTRKTFHIYKFSRSFAVGAQQIRHHTLKLKFIKAQFNIITLPHKRLLYACSLRKTESFPLHSHFSHTTVYLIFHKFTILSYIVIIKLLFTQFVPASSHFL